MGRADDIIADANVRRLYLGERFTLCRLRPFGVSLACAELFLAIARRNNAPVSAF